MPRVLFPHHTAGEEVTLLASLSPLGSPLLPPNPTYGNRAHVPKFVSRVARFLAPHGAQKVPPPKPIRVHVTPA